MAYSRTSVNFNPHAIFIFINSAFCHFFDLKYIWYKMLMMLLDVSCCQLNGGLIPVLCDTQIIIIISGLETIQNVEIFFSLHVHFISFRFVWSNWIQCIEDYYLINKKCDESLIIYYYGNYLFLMPKYPKQAPLIEDFQEKPEQILCFLFLVFKFNGQFSPKIGEKGSIKLDALKSHFA